MTDPREAAYTDVPEATPQREAAWRGWVDSYVLERAAAWTAEGESRADVLNAAGTILLDFGQIDDLPWMPVGEAMTHKLAAIFSDGQEAEGQERIDFMLATRTLETVNPNDYTLAFAYHFGVSTQRAVEMLAGQVETSDNEGRTALYRHSDADGGLLYIGIAKDPNVRAEQHAQNSPWFRFVAETRTEWFDTRESATDAERAAIKAEAPVFNETHNKANRDAAIAYLFDRIPVTA